MSSAPFVQPASTADSSLHLPATLKLLTGWCGPVTKADGQEYAFLGLVHTEAGAGAVLAPLGLGQHIEKTRLSLCWLSEVFLNLERMECRHRAAQCLGGSPLHSGVLFVSKGWFMNIGTRGFLAPPLTRADYPESTSVPTFAELDPRDNHRKLPDGSRWIEARALVLASLNES